MLKRTKKKCDIASTEWQGRFAHKCLMNQYPEIIDEPSAMRATHLSPTDTFRGYCVLHSFSLEISYLIVFCPFILFNKIGIIKLK